MNPAVLALLNEIRDAAERADTVALNRLITRYAAIDRRLAADIDALVGDLKDMDTPSRNRVQALASYARLMDDIAREVQDFAGYLRTELTAEAEQAAVRGEADGRKLFALALIAASLSNFPFALDDLAPAVAETSAGLATSDPLAVLAKYLAPDGELFRRIDLLAPGVADRVSQAILDNVALGKNPITIARLIRRDFGVGLSDALRMTRTTQLYAYREAGRANMETNGVTEWIWFATLDGDTCLSCYAMHGTRHPISEMLNDHHNGRCAQIPVVGDGLDVGNGRDAFDSLSAAEQKALAGPGKLKAYQEGRIEFGQFSGTHEDGVFGEMRVEATLKGLLGQ